MLGRAGPTTSIRVSSAPMRSASDAATAAMCSALPWRRVDAGDDASRSRRPAGGTAARRRARGSLTGRALALPTHWHHAPDHDRYESRSSASSSRHVACGAPDDVASSHRRRRPATTRSRSAGSRRRRTRCRHRCAGRAAPRSASSPSGERSRTTGMAMRSAMPTTHIVAPPCALGAQESRLDKVGGAREAQPPSRR